jgi:hypothetical protein
MPDSTDSLKEMLIQDVPLKFITNIIQKTPGVLRDAHGRAFEEPAWDEEEAQHSLGYFRFWLFQPMLRREAAKIGLEATVEYNKANNTPYTLIRARRFLFTGSHIKSKKDMPPTAWFREQHAALNEGLVNPYLPGFDTHKLLHANDIYGIICYSESVDDVNALGLMQITFVSADSKRIVDVVDLFELHQVMLERARAIAQQEVAVDIAHPRLKKKKK